MYAVTRAQPIWDSASADALTSPVRIAAAPRWHLSQTCGATPRTVWQPPFAPMWASGKPWARAQRSKTAGRKKAKMMGSKMGTTATFNNFATTDPSPFFLCVFLFFLFLSTPFSFQPRPPQVLPGIEIQGHHHLFTAAALSFSFFSYLERAVNLLRKMEMWRCKTAHRESAARHAEAAPAIAARGGEQQRRPWRNARVRARIFN